MEAAYATYNIFSRDENFAHIDEIRDFNELTLNLKWNEISTFTLKLPSQEFHKRWDVRGDPDTGIYPSLISPGSDDYYGGLTYGIIVTRNNASVGNNLFSGVITEATREYNSPYDDTVTLNGMADTYFLMTRFGRPDPAHNYNATDHWWKTGAGAKISHHVLTGAVEDCIGPVIDYNLGANAVSYRQLPYFAIETSGGAGATIENWVRLQPLYDVVKYIISLDTSENYGFRIKQASETGATRLYWQFLEPNDLSDTIIFGSDVGTVKNYKFTESRPKYNYCLVGGIGWDGAAQSSKPEDRLFEEKQDQESYYLYGRIEGFEDYGGQDTATGNLTSFVSEMDTHGLKCLRDNAKNFSVEIELTPNEMVQFMDDFNVGDTVSVALPAPEKWEQDMELPNLQLTKSIMEVKVSVTSDGHESVTPIISDPSSDFLYSGLAFQLAKSHETLLRILATRK